MSRTSLWTKLQRRYRTGSPLPLPTGHGIPPKGDAMFLASIWSRLDSPCVNDEMSAFDCSEVASRRLVSQRGLHDRLRCRAGSILGGWPEVGVSVERRGGFGVAE